MLVGKGCIWGGGVITFEIEVLLGVYEFVVYICDN